MAKGEVFFKKSLNHVFASLETSDWLTQISVVVGEHKSGLGSAVRVGFGDQHFGDVPLGFSGFEGF